MKKEISTIILATGLLSRHRRGVTLVEILLAIIILAMAVLPAIGTFSQSYGTATRQMEQEIALKLGEAVINVLMTTAYGPLARGTLPSVPLNVQLPSGAYSGSLDFIGFMATATPLVMGRITYEISAKIDTVFKAQNLNTPHVDAMELSYLDKWPIAGGPPSGQVATYSCFDDLIAINVFVGYGGGKPVRLSTFRADMTR